MNEYWLVSGAGSRHAVTTSVLHLELLDVRVCASLTKALFYYHVFLILFSSLQKALLLYISGGVGEHKVSFTPHRVAVA